MGEALRRDVGTRGARRRALAYVLAAGLAIAPAAAPRAAQDAPTRIDRGRFTILAYPDDDKLARSLLADAEARDSFPGLPRPRERVLISVAPDRRRFREWGGPGAPEWGSAFAFPEDHRIVMQGRGAGSDAGEPRQVLRHELAHLALHESVGDLAPRWFDEGFASFAAGEWGRDEALSTSIALVVSGVPPLDSLDGWFEAGATRADAAYAFSYRAVAAMAAHDPARGLAFFFRYWRESRSMDVALRRAYGITTAAFEQEWRIGTARRYGALAFIANVTLGAGLIALIVSPLYLLRRERDRRRFAQLVAADEAAERAAREGALAELLRSASPAPPAAPPAGDIPPPAC